ncbi:MULTISPECIES: TonB-dependent receptor [Methylomonas]|uniref:Iron complex outermembrane receptor protein n=1 Tax=Methylomonas methanica TaxID=421 RepID=A0ABY2CMM9_METMH|nr:MULTISPECIES: TonB-dependent receptor [Methylomonas]TCV83937.1 iron complex outermembrane receptor protein [Methylomonas methanica]
MKNQSEALENIPSYRLPIRSLLSAAILLALTSNVAIAETQKKNTSNTKNKVTEDAPASKPANQANSADLKAQSQQVLPEGGSTGSNTKDEVMEEMVITGEVAKDSHFTSPSTRLSRAEIERQNAQTTEEAVKYQPSLQIRQRYIGDPNGVLGIRGADMFSTARNMVYADGLPLHNQLQASFNGAPRWSMVGPNEIDAVDVVYGPFSAEYSGNSIGGVVNLKTHMPMKEEYYAETSYFVQPWENIGADSGTFDGNRQYFSYGNRLDKWSALLSYNRLEAESQPMSYFIDNTGLRNPTGTQTAVTGAVPTLDTRGTPSYIYGDTGPELVNTDLVKLKVGYDITPDLQAIFTGAFEERTRKSEKPRNYLTSASGAYYGDNNNNSRDAVYAGRSFNVLNSGFGPSDDERQTMQIGMQVKGAITDTWDIDTTFSYLDVIKDERRTAFFSPDDPRNQNTGQLQVFDDFNWKNYDLKLSTRELFGWKPLEFLAGYHFDNYNMNFKQFSYNSYSADQIGSETIGRRNQGEVTTNAMFGQFAYHFAPDWDLTLGARYEWWLASSGVGSNRALSDRSDDAISPKASLGFEPSNWKFRYSFGRSYRFPVIAEMYQNLQSPTSITTANENLKAEDGWHHNFMIEYGLDNGYVRVNVFRDDIRNTIQQVRRATGILTENAFQNIPATSTTGVELVYDQARVLDSDFDLNFNATWMNAIVEDGGPDINFQEADGSLTRFNLTGKQRIRLPEWRFNALATYHVNEALDVSMAGRYTNDSFNDIDNKDSVNNVFGAQDGFFFLDFKTSYRFKYDLLGKPAKSRVSFGINNLTDKTAYVFHPYPQRTFFIEGAISF